MRLSFLLIAIISFVLGETTSAANDSTYAVTISFNNKVGNEQVELGKQFSNSFGENFTITRLKYYITNVVFDETDGDEVKVPASYFLINEEDVDSKSLKLNLKRGSYSRVSFLIGVDSIKNVSGTQTEALDPMNGMFWTWNSGYIMAKLEATSSLSKAPNQLLEYHIGGFRSNQNTVRRVTLTFPERQIVETGNNKQPKIVIEADINKWFKGDHDLKIANHQVCMTPGDLAVKYADNYATMFSIASIDY